MKLLGAEELQQTAAPITAAGSICSYKAGPLESDWS